MIPVGRLAPVDQWDQALLDDLFANRLYPTGVEFRRHEGYPNTPGAVVIVPGRYWAGHEAEVSEAVTRYTWLLFMVTGDEEAVFDSNKVDHPNCRVWIQTPRQGRDYPAGARFFGVGYTPHLRDLSAELPDKSLDVFLSAQRTHKRRIEAFDALEDRPNSRVIPTQGFTEGVPTAEYAVGMMSAKVAPCPSGAVSPDSFRLYEALQAHCIPIADTVSPVDGETKYWDRIFYNGPAFPVLHDYESLPGYVDEALAAWPANANRITAWWMREKRSYVLALHADLQALGAL